MFHHSDQTLDEVDERHSKRQRIETPVRSDNNETSTVHPPISRLPTVGNYVIGTYTSQRSSESQLEIYYAWLHAGSPHNYVCYECHRPDELLYCETCCRSYHIDCLLTKPAEDRSWYCDVCKRRGWDINPPPSPKHIVTVTGRQDSQLLPIRRSFSGTASFNRPERAVSRLHNFHGGTHYDREFNSRRKSQEETAKEAYKPWEILQSTALKHETIEDSTNEKPFNETVPGINSCEQRKQESVRNTAIRSEDKVSDEAIKQMQAKIEILQEELRKRDDAPIELDNLRLENMRLKRKIQSLETSYKDRDPHNENSL